MTSAETFSSSTSPALGDGPQRPTRWRSRHARAAFEAGRTSVRVICSAIVVAPGKKSLRPPPVHLIRLPIVVIDESAKAHVRFRLNPILRLESRRVIQVLLSRHYHRIR